MVVAKDRDKGRVVRVPTVAPMAMTILASQAPCFIALDIRIEPLSAPPTDTTKPGRHGHPISPRLGLSHRFLNGASLVRRKPLIAPKLLGERYGTPDEISGRERRSIDGALVRKAQDMAATGHL